MPIYLVCALILASHALSVFGEGAVARVAGYVGIALHLALYALLLVSEVAIDLSVLIFLCSVALYAAMCGVRVWILKRPFGAKAETTESEPEAGEEEKA